MSELAKVAEPSESPTAIGYLHQSYAESFAELGTPWELRHARGWVLRRPTPLGKYYDAMGCYPLLCCGDWQRLGDDLRELQNAVISFSFVADPFGNHTPELFRSLCEVVQPYKQHYVADLALPLEAYTSARHRKFGRRALQRIRVEVCGDPATHLEEWIRLYGYLVERHHISGMRRFSPEALRQQLSVPGLVMFRASEGGEPLGLDLWYVQGDVAQAHLAGTSPRGYELHVSYGLKLFILQYFTGKVRWLNFGGTSGVDVDPHDGLAVFKRGWSSETRTAFFCGKILNPAVYGELARANQGHHSNFFPAYRQGEFS
jgi:hypothetical protein